MMPRGSPCPKTSAEATEAAAWHQSIYGADAGARNRTLKDLGTHARTLRDAQADYAARKAAYDALAKDKGASAAAKQAALDAANAAHAAWKVAYDAFDATYKKYRALPEEADAWAVGDRVQARYQGGNG